MDDEDVSQSSYLHNDDNQSMLVKTAVTDSAQKRGYLYK